jgi:hypothetical protein
LPLISKPDDFLRLRLPEVEKVFTQFAIDWKEILVLDGIDKLEDPIGFRIRSHDLYGPLPDIVLEDTLDRYPVLDSITRETAKLIAMVRIRQDLRGMFRDCSFLLPTSTDNGSVVGIRFRGKTVLAEAPSHWEAYHQLVRNAVEDLL